MIPQYDTLKHQYNIAIVFGLDKIMPTKAFSMFCEEVYVVPFLSNKNFKTSTLRNHSY